MFMLCMEATDPFHLKILCMDLKTFSALMGLPGPLKNRHFEIWKYGQNDAPIFINAFVYELVICKCVNYKH